MPVQTRFDYRLSRIRKPASQADASNKPKRAVFQSGGRSPLNLVPDARWPSIRRPGRKFLFTGKQPIAKTNISTRQISPSLLPATAPHEKSWSRFPTYHLTSELREWKISHLQTVVIHMYMYRLKAESKQWRNSYTSWKRLIK